MEHRTYFCHSIAIFSLFSLNPILFKRSLFFRSAALEKGSSPRFPSRSWLGTASVVATFKIQESLQRKMDQNRHPPHGIKKSSAMGAFAKSVPLLSGIHAQLLQASADRKHRFLELATPTVPFHLAPPSLV